MGSAFSVTSYSAAAAAPGYEGGLEFSGQSLTIPRRSQGANWFLPLKMAKTVNEQALVDRCRLQDREAQRVLFEQTSSRVYGLLLRMTRNPEDAFDLTQEVYLKAFARIEQFDGRSALSTWLHRIAVNEALQFQRRGKSIRLKTEQLALRTEKERDDREATALRLDIEDALAKLEPPDQVIILLRHQDGLDYRTIAQVLDCAEGTVASRLNRARDRLREYLRESYDRGEESDASVHPTSGR